MDRKRIPNDNSKNLTRSGIMAVLAPFRWIIISAVVLFASAGHINIPKAWVYFSTAFVASTISAVIIVKFSPELANQRGKIQPGTKLWDKVILAIFFPVILIILPAVIGLDVGRYHWSSLGIEFALLGFILYIIAFVLIKWAMLTNKYFEVTARIQKERGHQVITAGPYGIVRHPGYVAMILSVISMPLIIGSVYGLIPAGLAVVALVIRTAFEDKMLNDELEGYPEYGIRVKYRLVPGIW